MDHDFNRRERRAAEVLQGYAQGQQPLTTVADFDNTAAEVLAGGSSALVACAAYCWQDADTLTKEQVVSKELDAVPLYPCGPEEAL